MIELGKTQELEIVRTKEFGVYLRDVYKRQVLACFLKAERKTDYH